jgi:uncharacterized protein YegJ (DUF2314 family)
MSDKNKTIEVGDFVKVRSHGERFWCIVTGFSDVGIVGKVNNHLIAAPYEFGQEIGFLLDDVIDLQKQGADA